MKASMASIAALTAAVFLATYSFAYADTLHDPYTDTIQFWAGIFSAVESLGHQIAADLAATTNGLFDDSTHPVSVPRQTASAASAVTNPFGPQPASIENATTSEPSLETTNATSDPSTFRQNVASGDFAPADSNTEPLIERVPEDDSALSLQVAALARIVGNLALLIPATPQSQVAAIDQSVAADGNPTNPFAAENAINNLSDVTITDANLTASEIPALNYVPLSGGTVTGNLSVTGTISGTISASSSALTNLTATNATTTTLFATDASTTNATSTNLFAALGNFTTGIINTLSGTELTYTAASTTNLSVSGEGYFGTASTTNLIVSGSPSGFLQTNAQGVVSATSTFSASSLFGTLSVGNGGTGSTTLTGILKGNGTGAVQSAIGGTDYEFPLTFSTGLNRTGNTITNTGVLSIGSGYASTTGTTISFSTTTQAFNGLTIAQQISSPSGSNMLFTPTISGTLNNSGLTNSSIIFTSPNQTLSTPGSIALGGTANFDLNLAHANNWTGLQQFNGAASSTLFSAYGPAYFGATATSSFEPNGALSLVSNGLTVGTSQLVVSGGSVGIGTSNPSATLDVHVSSGSNGVRVYQPNTGQDAFFSLYPTSSGAHEWRITASDPTRGSAGADFTVEDATAGAFRFAIDTSGNVGIGTTTPWAQLSITSPNQQGGSTALFGVASTTGASLLTVLGNGNVGIGVTSPSYMLQVTSPSSATNPALYVTSGGGNGYAGEFMASNGATYASLGSPAVAVDGYSPAGSAYGVEGYVNGNSAIGVLGEAIAANSIGVEGEADNTASWGSLGYNIPSGYYCYSGGGSYSLDCSGPTVGVSDARLKNIQSYLSPEQSLAGIMQLQPLVYLWKDSKMNVAHPDGNMGFTAQNVQSVFPLLVGTTTATTTWTPNGTLALNYQDLIVPTVSAVQQLDFNLLAIASSTASTTPDSQSFAEGFFQNLFAQITQWFANAQNGVHDLYAIVIHASDGHFSNEVCIGKSTGGEVCITGDQLAALVSQTGAAALANSSPADSATDTPPQIQINGDNPAIVKIGATYNDLGATITGPTADLNLGIRTFLNGAPMSPIQIDTSAAATDTIDYIVTDQNGLTSTSTRTVIVEASSIVPSDDTQAPTDATTTEKNVTGTDTATSTDSVPSPTAATTSTATSTNQ